MTPTVTLRDIGKCAGIIPLLAVLVLVAVLVSKPHVELHEAPWLLACLNTVFLCGIPLLVAYLAGRSYQATRSRFYLLMGCGLLFFGISCFMAGWMLPISHDPNSTVTLHNLGCLCAGASHLLGVHYLYAELMGNPPSGTRSPPIGLVYAGVLGLCLLLLILVLQGELPAFYILHEGMTPLRQWVLGLALGFFGLSACLMIELAWTVRAEFAYWYGLALLLIAAGLVCVLMQPSVGGGLGWVGRGAQYVGCLYFLLALVFGRSEFRQHHPTPTSPATLWPYLEYKVKERTAALEELKDNLVREIAERQRIEDHLRTGEERFRAIANYTVDWESWVNPEGQLLWVNPAVEQHTGYTVAECLEMPDYPRPLIVPNEQELMKPWLEGWKHGTKGANVEFQIQRKNGSTSWAAVSWQPIYNAHGTALGCRSSVRDISKKKLLDAQLYQAQKLEAIGQMVGGIAHDFNNVLSSVLMQLDVLLHYSQLEEETKLHLKELMTDAERAAGLTRQLLMFSRRSVLEIKVLNLNEVVDNLLKMLGRLLGENIDIQFKRKTALPSVEADTGMLEQVLMNLAMNARDAMPAGGQISIGTESVDIKEDQIKPPTGRRPGQFVCLSVADTGSGMDDAIRQRIFEPFFTTKEPGKGTGLGLATVFGIVSQHRGWVEVESQLGQGSVFRVFLPASSKPLSQAMSDNTALLASRGHETILLVEDERSVRVTLAQALRMLGYRVFEAASTHEALVIWTKHGGRVDLLLTDMVLPDAMTGLELAQKLRLEAPKLKVILSSGYALEKARSSQPPLADICYLTKPYQMSRLGPTIRQCLDQSANPSS